MSLKPGDTVRFLNTTGGGRVVSIDSTRGIAHVEDADGFEVPVLIRECVIVNPERSLGFTERPQILPKEKPASAVPAPKEAGHPEKIPPVKDIITAIETPEGDTLNIVLGFEPENIKSLSTSSFDAYLVNDSNYWLFAVMMTRASDSPMWETRFAGQVEPNMEVHLCTLETADLPKMDRVAIQYVAYKDGKPFDAKSPVFVEHRLDTTKFAKLHCFRSNTYFEGPVIALDITRNDAPAADIPLPDARAIESAMRETKAARSQSSHAPARSKSSKPSDQPLVIDLHATELFDDLRGLSPADILNAQIDRFASVMDACRREAGRKIIFIHGKGDGVLRKAILKELSHRYKGHDVQDASFREYGFGATQVTIRPEAAQKK